VANKATIATVLSVLMVGIGQAYLGRFYRGAIMFVVGIALVLTLYFLFGPFGVIFATAYWIWNIFDAYKIGHAKQADNAKPEQCPNCSGTGTVQTHSSMASIYAPSLNFTRCPAFSGSGRFEK